jgi:hypothetical protein
VLRRLVISGCAAALTAVVLQPITAQAIPFCDPGHQCRYEWHNAEGDVVGWRDVLCNGQVFNGGTQTGSLTFNQVRCLP